LRGELGPHVTQCRLGRDLYLYTKWYLDPSSRLGTIDVGQKLGGGSKTVVPSVCLSACLCCLSVTLVYCGQTVGRINMKLGMRVGLDPGHRPIVLDGTQLPSPKGKSLPPQFSAHVRCGQTAGWIKMPLGMEVGLRRGDFLLDGDAAPLPKKGDRAPNFRPISIVTKRLDASRCHLVRRQDSAHATLC